MKLQNLYFSFLKSIGVAGVAALLLFSCIDVSAQPGSGRITPTTGASKKKTTTTVKKTTTTVSKKNTSKRITRKPVSTAKNFNFYYNLGLSFYDKGDYRNAIANYTQAIRLNATSADAYYNRALAYYDSEDYFNAVADYTQSIRLNPQADAYNNRGLAYEYSGDNAKAAADYRQALRLNPGYDLAQQNLDRIEGDTVTTSNGYSRAGSGSKNSKPTNNTNNTNSSCNDSECYAQRADDFYDDRDFGNALINYNKAIELAPREAGAYVRRGFIYHYTGEISKAYDDYNTAVRLDPSLKSEPYIQCMLYSVSASNAPTVINDCNKTINEFPSFSLAYYKRGVAYYESANNTQALQDFTKSIELFPDFFNSHVYRGLIYYRQQKYNQAINEYTSAIQITGANSQKAYLAYYNRGLAYESQNNYTQAAADYRKSYQVDPTYTAAKTKLDEVLRKQRGNY